mgnify:CR=1 FL=1
MKREAAARRIEVLRAQRLHDLEHEVRVAVRLLADTTGQLLRQPRRAEHLLEQEAEVLGAEAAEGTLLEDCAAQVVVSSRRRYEAAGACWRAIARRPTRPA